MSSVVSSNSPSSVVYASATNIGSIVGGTTGTSSGIAGTDVAAPPLYQSFGAAFGTGLVGLSQPKNSEDSAIILSEISLAVDEAARDNSDATFKNVIGGLRASFGSAIAVITNAANQMAAKNAEQSAAQADLGAATAQLAQAQADPTTPQSTIDALNTRIQTDQTTISADIAALNDANRSVSLAVMTVFSQLAVALRTQGGGKAVSDNRDANFDQLRDNVLQTLKDFQKTQDDSDQDVTRVRGDADVQADERRVDNVALGLVAGLADVLRTLSSLGSPSSNADNGLDDPDHRHRLAV